MTKAEELAAANRGEGCLGRSQDDEPSNTPLMDEVERLRAQNAELLAMLIRVDDYFYDSRMKADEYDAMRHDLTAAIAKAEGRS